MYKESKPPKEGGSKKKGVAKESDAQEVKNLENDIPVDEVAGATKKKGGAKKKGSADYDTSGMKGSHEHPHTEGAGRMGFTQNFGAARQNSYAKGAARVASIMSFGASKKKRGPADNDPSAPHKHPHVGSVDVGMGSGVEVTGDASGINNTITSTKNEPISVHSTNSQVFKKNYGDAKKDEKNVYKENINQVRLDLKANKDLQKLRFQEGKDYQRGTGTDNQVTIRRS